jgi:type IV pilus assembly protein PilN
MYSLDVNFLKDRPDYLPPTQGPKPQRQTGAMTPLIVGVIAGLLLPALAGGLWLFLQQQNAALEGEDAKLQAELQRQNGEKQKITQLQTEINKVNAETQELAGVFNQIKPWSAILQDIRERVPSGLQIQTIEQKQVAAATTPTPSPSPSPNASGATPQAASAPIPTTQLEISGFARSFDDVGNFMVTLKQSSFLKSNETQLVSAQLEQSPSKIEVNTAGNRGQSTGRVTYQLPKAVKYKIQTSLNDVPASELVRELDRKGAVGLVTRIRTLQEKGVIQP